MRGGTSRHLADVVEYALGTDHHVAVPTAGAPGSGALYDGAAIARMQEHGAVVHAVEMDRRPWDPANASAVAGLVRLARRVRPDVVHGHSAVGGAVARLAGTAARVPVAYTAHGVAEQTAYRLVERALGPLTWRWVAVSASEADLARRRRLAPPDRLVTIPNGIPTVAPPSAGPDLRERLGLPARTPLVGTVIRLVAQKAPVDFVAVCAEVGRGRPDVHFVLVGMGPLEGEVTRAVAASGIGPRWHQVEHLPSAAEAVADLDVFVLASRFEGAPYTPLEAMRAGVAVVLSDVVGNRDCIEDGVSGLLRPAGDTPALAAAVLRLLDDDRLRRRIGEAGRGRVADRFDVRRMGAALDELYLTVPTR